MPLAVELLYELIERFENAAKASLATRGRRGSVVHLGPEDGDEVIVSGDLHGHRENFNKLVKEAALDKHPKRHLVMQEVLHGGPKYPQGGCMSHLVLEDVAKLKVRYPDRVHFLLSNHELAEYLKLPIVKAGVSQNFLLGMGLEMAYGPASARIAESYHTFIRTLPLAIRLKNGVFISHSLPDKASMPTFDAKVFSRPLTEKDISPGGSAYALVWGRDYDAAHVEKFVKLVKSNVLISGHEPTPAGFQSPSDHQIIFDCSGPICCSLAVPLDRPVSAAELKAAIKRL